MRLTPKRYEPGDDGLRFQDLTYHGNFRSMEPVPDGILGDKMMKSRAKSGCWRRSPRRTCCATSSRSTSSTTSTTTSPGTSGTCWSCARPRAYQRNDPAPGVRDPGLHARVLPLAGDPAHDHRRGGGAQGDHGHRRHARARRSARRSTRSTTGASAPSASAWAAAGCSRWR